MSPPAGVVAIVDAYSTARYFAPLFHARGYDTLHVQSAPRIPAVFTPTFRPDDFFDNLAHDGDLAETVRSVERHRPVVLLAGSDSGVALADELSQALGLRSNGTARSTARRNKFEMVETIKAAGVPGAEQIVARDRDAVLAWYARRGGGRVVVKPVDSAGNDGVFFCDGEQAVLDACDALLGTDSVLDLHNFAVVAQEYLVGTEYYVNTVSLDGVHHVCDVHSTSHLSANGIADLLAGSRLLPRRGDPQDALVDYTLAVLDVLGIRNGPAHTELKMTPKGPRLIETAARICGADLPLLVDAALGESQLAWTVDAYVDPDRFRARCADEYAIDRHAVCVNMVSPRAGVLASYPRMPELEALESFERALTRVAPGSVISRTVGDFTYPMLVHLLNESPDALLRDYAAVRALDGDGFYDYAAVPETGHFGPAVQFPQIPRWVAPEARGEQRRPRLLVLHAGYAAGGPSVFGAQLGRDADIVFIYREDLLLDVERDLGLMTSVGEAHAATSLGEVVQTAQEVSLRGPVDGIITFTDLVLPDASAVAEELGLRQNSQAALAITRDKLSQRGALHAAGVPVPRYAPLRDVDDVPAALAAVPLPAVLKPAFGYQSLLVRRIDSPDDLEAAVVEAQERYREADFVKTLAPDFLLEELLVGTNWHGDPHFGDYVSVESLIADGEIQHLYICDKRPLMPPFRETGDVMPSSLPAQAREDILAMTSQALAALGLTHGATHTEIKLTRDGPRIIEVNPRLGGGVAFLLADAAHYNIFRALGSLAVGGPLPPPPQFTGFATVIHPVTPARLVRVDAVEGFEEIAALPGVTEARPSARPGSIPDWQMGEGRLIEVSAVLPTLDGILDFHDAVTRELRCEYHDLELSGEKH